MLHPHARHPSMVRGSSSSARCGVVRYADGGGGGSVRWRGVAVEEETRIKPFQYAAAALRR